MNHGFIKVAAAIPSIKVADCDYNSQQIISLIEKAEKQDVSLVVFPELSITGYTCADLFLQPLLLQQAEKSLDFILKSTKDLDITSVIGLPVVIENDIINAAVVIYKGKILGLTPKIYIPNYNEFYEARWFASGINLINTNIGY